MTAVRVLVVDNYDSFVFNLVQGLGELGAELEVRRNDEIDADGAEALAPDGVVISPGPGRPEAAGASMAIVERLAGRAAVLGVCLGHQCIGALYGGQVVPAPELVHGKTSLVHHGGAGVLDGLPNPFPATRYHSLVVERATLPATLELTAETADGVVMGLRHRELAVEGVQFHPESILTEGGQHLLANFLATAGRR